MQKHALSVKEACQALSIGKTKLYELLGSGQLNALRLGGRTIIKEEEISRFLSGLQQVHVGPRVGGTS